MLDVLPRNMRPMKIALVLFTILGGLSHCLADDTQKTLSSPSIVKLIESYQKASTTKDYQESLAKLLDIQKIHRKHFDRVKIGKSVFHYPGLIAMGRLRYTRAKGGFYQLRLGLSPKHPEDNLPDGLTALLIDFDDSGIVTGKEIPRYKW